MNDAFFHALPKIELHAHLLGTVRKETLADWVRRERAPVGADQIDAFYTRGEKPVGVLHVLRLLERTLLRSADDLHRLTVEYLAAAAAHGVRHAEFFWNPTGTARDSGIAYRAGVEAIVRGMADAEHDHGITSLLIPAIDREAGARAALEMVGWVIADRREQVAGIGIDYRETEYPPELFIEAYMAARRAGLKATAHAGEFGCPWTHVRTALDDLCVDRIDHGYTAIDDADFVRRCADRGIVFTVVPTNSHYLRALPRERWALEHPIRHMPEHGLRIHPNTDDPTLHGVTPSQAWQKMHADFGFGIDRLREFMHAGIDAAWVGESTRRRWRIDFDRSFDGALAAAACEVKAAIRGLADGV